MIARHELNFTNAVTEKFRRNEDVVDRERLNALAEKMRKSRGKDLDGDHQALLERCMETFTEENHNDGWAKMESMHRDIRVWMRYFPPKAGMRSVVTGKATAVLDCSAEEAAAWVFDYCSNERMRTR